MASGIRRYPPPCCARPRSGVAPAREEFLAEVAYYNQVQPGQGASISAPIRQVVQADGRIRRWAQVPEMENRYLRVVLLPDGETVHNAFFDRRFTP